VLSLPAIAETEECVPIGNGKYYLRRAGEALHAEVARLCDVPVEWSRQHQMLGLASAESR
jgi:hypothetical protein